MMALIILIAVVLGSFANVLIHRLPMMILDDESSVNLAQPASHCPQCHTPLRWWHNIPLLSFVFLRRRCAACGQLIAWRYFIVELGAAFLAAVCVWQWGVTIQAGAYFVFLYILWVLAWIDALHYLLPDVLTLSLLWLGLLYHAAFEPARLADSVFAAAFGYLLLSIVYFVYYGVTGKQGIGFGDMKLLAAIGVWLGVVSIANVLIMACVFALLFALLMRFKRNKILPFGPFLAAAAVFVLMTQFDLGAWL